MAGRHPFIITFRSGHKDRGSYYRPRSNVHLYLESASAAIEEFQADNPPLAVDGICGPLTRARLVEVYGC